MATGARVSENVGLAASRLVHPSKYPPRYNDTLLFFITFVFANLSNWNSVSTYTYNCILCLTFSQKKKITKRNALSSRARARLIRERGLIPDSRVPRVYRCRFPRRIQRVARRFGNHPVTIPDSRTLPSYFNLTYANRERETLIYSIHPFSN